MYFKVQVGAGFASISSIADGTKGRSCLYFLAFLDQLLVQVPIVKHPAIICFQPDLLSSGTTGFHPFYHAVQGGQYSGTTWSSNVYSLM
jgi:hypothetical protein